jgi:hypothetical protein
LQTLLNTPPHHQPAGGPAPMLLNRARSAHALFSKNNIDFNFNKIKVVFEFDNW